MDWEPFVYETNPDNVLFEWDKKFRGTFVRLNGKIVKTTHVDNPFIYFQDKDGVDGRVKATTNEVIDISFPKVGCFTYNGSLAVFTRQPARQFRKGICADNSKILLPMHFSRGFGALHPDFPTLTAAFSEKYLDPHDLVKTLFSKGIKQNSGGAISCNWGMRTHPISSTKAILYFREFAVGEVTDDGKCTPVVPSFRQEIADFNRDFKVGMTIV